MVADQHCVILLAIAVICINSELLPSLELKPSGYITFKNETRVKTGVNIFSLYLELEDEVQEKQHIVSISSESRSEQFIRVSLIQMRLSVLANLRHPAVSRWFMVGKEFVAKEVYYVEIYQNDTNIHITINNETTVEELESVEDLVFPAEISIGYIQTTPGINGSIAGLTYNGVSTLHSYHRRDTDFNNVSVRMGGEVTVKEKEWVTLAERNKRYCPHTNHFPKSEVGTEIRLENCQQNIARAICGDTEIWLVEKCEDGKSVKGRSGDDGDGHHTQNRFPKKYLLICIGAGAAAIFFLTIVIVAILVKRSRRNRIHRYKMAKDHDYQNDYQDDYNHANFPQRLNGISTLPSLLKNDSLTTKPRPNSLEMSCSTLDNPGSEILENRIPVFAATTNPLSKTEDLYPVYMTSEPNPERDTDIISTILGERAERNYTNTAYNNTSLIPSSLLNSNSELSSWQDV